MDNDNDKQIIKSPYYSLEEIRKYSDVLKRGLEDLGISITNPRISENPTELGKIIFVAWVANFIDSQSFLSSYERYKSESEVIQTKYIKKYFVYLIAGVVIVLANELEKQHDENRKQYIQNIIDDFASIARPAMDKLSGSEGGTDKLIEGAYSYYSKLIDTNPTEHPGFSFTWAMEWFDLVGIKETNPAVLFEFSLSWMDNFIYLSKAVSEILAQK